MKIFQITADTIVVILVLVFERWINRSRTNWRASKMVAGAVLAFILAMLAPSAFAETPAGWSTNLSAAIQSARAKDQPVLLYFTASWCGPCKLMARTTLTNEAVVTALQRVSPVALDIDEHPQLAAEREVRAVPTFKMLTPSGMEVASVAGYREAGDFIAWITNSVADMHRVVARAEVFRKRLAITDGLLREGSPAKDRQAAVELFDLCADREESIREAARDRLKRLAARDPAILLKGLNHPRLATRIEVANLLREQLGNDFGVDPWSAGAERAAAVEDWQKRLAASPATSGKSL